MTSELSLFWFSAITVVCLLSMLLLKAMLHYKYLVGLDKIPRWRGMFLSPFTNFQNVFLLTMPFFTSYDVDLKLEELIRVTLRAFWIGVLAYFLLLFTVLMFV
jgi:hypothetical protein